MNNQKQQTIACNLMIGIALVIGFVAGARAETISEHVTDHVAIEKAVNAVLPCAEIDIVQEKKFELTDEYKIIGANLRIECVKGVASDTYTLTATWTAPTHRENDSPINGPLSYELFMSGVIISTTETTHTINNVPPGTYDFKVLAVEGDEKSDWSETVTRVAQ